VVSDRLPGSRVRHRRPRRRRQRQPGDHRPGQLGRGRTLDETRRGPGARPAGETGAGQDEKPKTIVEVKGEGGYCLAPPSPAACHRTGRCYTFVGGKDLTAIPVISEEEREILLDCARALNCWEDPRRRAYVARPRRGPEGGARRPGDDFNLRGDWGEILQRHGWKWVGSGGAGTDLWRRPGKATGSSATTNFGGSDLLFVFSSNAEPFDEWTAYTKFHAYALLEYDEDFRAAAAALAKRGYGQARDRRKGRVRDPFSRYAGYTTRSRPRS
jgi:putative DNA primase/helicase